MFREFFARPWVKRTLISVLALVLISIVAITAWMFKLDRNIAARFAEKRFAPPVEFYSAPEVIRPGAKFTAKDLDSLFTRRSFVRRTAKQSMSQGDFSIWTGDECRAYFGDVLAPAKVDPTLDQELTASQTGVASSPAPNGTAESANAPLSAASIASCVVFVNRGAPSFSPEAALAHPINVQIVAIASDGRVVSVLDRDSRRTMEAATIEPELFAQYYGDKPVLRKVVSFSGGEVPPMCLHALIATEDSKFYEHPGISVTGLARAVLKRLMGGRLEGGSTITQQLVKNYFLTDERTIKRKVIEIAMAFLVERHASKDDILETYINLIYMGQNGPFEVRGFAAASEHYFGKPLRDLDTHECALLAGVLNSPGLFDPFRKPENALKRRALVLSHMERVGVLDSERAEAAKKLPLPLKPQRPLTEPAPYFVQTVRRIIHEQAIDEQEGLRIYTTLNLRAQEAAHLAVREGLDRLEKNNKTIKAIKEKGKSLEAVLLASDPQTGYVESLVGGRGYLATQFNRAIDSRRQVGSVMKPFVYLAAFESLTPDGQSYTPLTPVADNETTHRFEGQRWTPRNYDGTYRGDVPIYWALKESLNAGTVNLGMQVGLGNIVDVSKRLGVKSEIKQLPSLTLGAFEMAPIEILQAYASLANFGKKIPLTFLVRVEELGGQPLYTFQPEIEQAAEATSVAELVGVMKQTMISGTARSARLYGFTHPSAGKTGTTNDQKDAWFAGFTPHHNAVVWVGYDDNTPHKLTGASGSVPIWTQYMKAYAGTQPADDFAWPAGTEIATLVPEQLLGFGVPDSEFNDPKNPVSSVELIFREGRAPRPPEGAATPVPNEL